MTDIAVALRAIYDCDAIPFTALERRYILTAIKSKLQPQMIDGSVVETFQEYLARVALIAPQDCCELEQHHSVSQDKALGND